MIKKKVIVHLSKNKKNIYLIVGHRGTGKTYWLKKLKRLLADSTKKLKFFDLDQEIKKTTKQNLTDFFKNKKTKKEFRSLEHNTLTNLINKYKCKKTLVFIAVGAGFDWKAKLLLPQSMTLLIENCHVIHLIREVDSQGRVFFDRPRLSNKNPYEEYMFYYPQREKIYQQIKTQSFVLPEQDFSFNKTEKLFFTPFFSDPIGSVVTLNKKSLPAYKDQWPDFIQKRLTWGFHFFELRDDQLSNKELEYLLKIIPKYRQLLSFRSKKNKTFKKCIKPKKKDGVQSVHYDWPLERGPAPFSPPPVLSLHERKARESIKGLGQRLIQHKAGHFKLAVPIKNFSELREGHFWFLNDIQNRSFLPVSSSPSTQSQHGRWRWYRQIFGPYMKYHFIREGPSFVTDQPFLYEHLIALNVKNSLSLSKNKSRVEKQPCFPLFSAVVGDPVELSASPGFHRSFFEKKGMIFVKIKMSEKEMNKKSLKILQQLGLRFLAVTSPLKKKAFSLCDTTDPVARSLGVINTLVWSHQKWKGFNTDLYGFKKLKEKTLHQLSNPFQDVAVWGGGGVLPLLKKELPCADFYSARSGHKKHKTYVNKRGPETVIWAVGRHRMPFCRFPPSFWQPKWVLDLNYTEDSPGREYALLSGAKYISGKKMFENQALKQHQLFLRHI